MDYPHSPHVLCPCGKTRNEDQVKKGVLTVDSWRGKWSTKRDPRRGIMRAKKNEKIRKETLGKKKIPPHPPGKKPKL